MKRSMVGYFKQVHSNQWILLFILVIGSILRFYNFGQLPYSHDELSALLRTNYTNFHDLIEHGIKTDFHPAGIQVFLFYWVKLLGTAEWLVKLPFVIASIASIYLAFLVGKKMRNETVGLIAAAFLASTQYMIMHGTTARPYASGLFFILLLFNALLNLSDQSQKKYWQNWIIFIVAGTCAAYNHHLSLLSAGIIGIVGFAIIPRERRVHYIIAGAAICILYLPHLPILLHQLGKGGIGGADGWLGAPDIYFFEDYFYYLFHYSFYTLALMITLVIVGSVLHFRKNKLIHESRSYKKMMLLSLILFVAPIGIAYYYSVAFNPIIQFSVIIFTHFFLYIILFGHFKLLSAKWNFLIVFLILIINSATLIVTRQHYNLNYNSSFIVVTDDLDQYREKNPSLPAIIESRWDFIDFYAKRKGYSTKFKKYSDFTSRTEFLQFLDSISTNSDSLYLGDNSHLPYFVIPDIQRFYPFIVNQNNYSGATTYLFSKSFQPENIKPFKGNDINYSSNLIEWAEINGEKLIRNANGYFVMDSAFEYGPSLTIPLRKVLSHPSNYIDVIVPMKPDSLEKDILIVCELVVDDVAIQWEGGASEVQKLNGICSEINTTMKLGKRRDFENGILKVYLWNPNKIEIQFKDIIIQQRQGNPFLYGLVDEIIR